eukprot:m.175365 g.175365  ORF g.175365 m.175365 type:complete len:102 (-) comp53316_c0_seq23:997-1302(-)
MPLVRQIQDYCKRNNLTILARCIPSAENILADQLSRHLDKSDWRVSDHFFREVEVDRFATSTNAMSQRYNSWHPKPSSLGDSRQKQSSWCHTGPWQAGCQT